MNTKRRENCQLRNDWKERIIRIGDEQTSLQNQFDNLRNDISDYPPRIAALETGVNALDGRLIIAESDIADAENRITECESDIDALEAEVDALDGRVTITETDISDAESRITACEADIDRIDAELVDKTGDINALANRMSLAEADIDTLDARVDGIDADLADKTSKINNLTNRMSLAEADIDNLDTRVSGIETGEILLSQLVPDADKDMGGKTLSNVNLEDVTVRNIPINPTRQNDQLLYDMQAEIENGTLSLYNKGYNIITETDLSAPYSTCVESENALGGIGTPFGDYIPVSPGEVISGEVYYKPLINNGGSYPYVILYIARYDKDKKFVAVNTGRVALKSKQIDWENEKDTWVYVTGSYTVESSHTPYSGSDGGPVRYIRLMPSLNWSQNGIYDKILFSGLRFWKTRNYPMDIHGRNISADGVVIKDGGTVDGVDISTHTHNGTAIGGPKISYNDLVDKPTIPTKLSQLETDYNNQRVSAAEKAEWDSKADGSIFTPAKAAEWDGKQEKLATFASSNYKYYHDDEVQVSSTTMTKVKTFTFSKAGVTTARVYFEFFGTPGRTGYAEVRKNGIVLATSEHSEGYEYLPMTHDLDLNISAGDTVELWLRSGYEGAVFRVRNFRIGYDIGMGGSVTIS